MSLCSHSCVFLLNKYIYTLKNYFYFTKNDRQIPICKLYIFKDIHINYPINNTRDAYFLFSSEVNCEAKFANFVM